MAIKQQSTQINIGIAGLGTVGGNVVRILTENIASLKQKTGRPIVIKAVSARDKSKDRGLNLQNIIWYDNPLDLAKDQNINIVVELIGGADGVARQLAEASLAAGKHYVTANKALIATHGYKLAEIAENNNVALAFEPAVAGGIPIIKILKEALVASTPSRITGIMNGTCNYILTKMQKTGSDFATILKEAQDLGYAEADPSFDIDGIDTAHKLAILTSIGFQVPVNLGTMYIEGIRDIELTDVKYAEELGYKIKLLGITTLKSNKIEQHVYPCLVKNEHQVAAASYVDNAIFIEGNNMSSLLLQGPGAGGSATATAVIADIVDIAAGRFTYPFSVPTNNLKNYQAFDFNSLEAEYYLRITVNDKAGVLAGISDILRDANISVESIVQKPVKKGENVNIVVITHTTDEANVNKALERITEVEGVVTRPKLLRIA